MLLCQIQTSDSKLLLSQIQTSLILKTVRLSASMSNTDIFDSLKKVNLGASMSNTDILYSQKSKFECFYVK